MDYQWKANGYNWRLGAVGQGLGRPGPGPWRRGQPGAGRQRRQGQGQGAAVAAHQALQGLQGFHFEGPQVLLKMWEKCWKNIWKNMTKCWKNAEKTILKWSLIGEKDGFNIKI